MPTKDLSRYQFKSWLVDKLVAKKISKENAIDACNKLISQEITTSDIFISCDESEMTIDFLKKIGISALGVRSAISIRMNEAYSVILVMINHLLIRRRPMLMLRL